jgi:hypothetical protein
MGEIEKAPGEPLELAPQAKSPLDQPPGILSTSRIAPILKIPTTFIRESFEAVIEKDVLIAFYRAALTSDSVWRRSALSNYAAGRPLNANVDIVPILRIWPNIVSVSGSDGWITALNAIPASHKRTRANLLTRGHAAQRFQKIFVIDLAVMNPRRHRIATRQNTAETLVEMLSIEFAVANARVEVCVIRGQVRPWTIQVHLCLRYRCRIKKGATNVIQKRVLNPDRVRRLPKCDWSWVDRRFLREFASKLSGDTVFLYYILVAVSDKNGLSYYSDNALALMVRTSLPSLLRARQELIEHDLVAYQAPLVQILSLPASEQTRSTASHSDKASHAVEVADLQMLIAALAQKASVTGKEA